MSKSSRIILSIAALAVILPVLAGAHETKRSGTLDILLHRDPLESPVAREPATLYFSVTDSAEKFEFSDCDCRVAIRMGTESLVDRPLAAADEAPDWGEHVSRVPFTFPRLGVYAASIQGRSKTGRFADFRLDYDVRVETESSAVPVTPIEPEEARISALLRNYYAIGGTLALLAIITNEIIIRRKKA